MEKESGVLLLNFQNHGGRGKEGLLLDERYQSPMTNATAKIGDCRNGVLFCE
jgi:hypothetical protein